MSHTTYVHHDSAQEGGEKRREGGGTRVCLTQALMQGHTKMGNKTEGGGRGRGGDYTWGVRLLSESQRDF